MEILSKIKRLIVSGRYRFTIKAAEELDIDGLNETDALESILNAQGITKTLRSRFNPARGKVEKLYVIQSFNYSGTLIYTKGKVAVHEGEETYYVLISSKRSTLGDFP